MYMFVYTGVYQTQKLVYCLPINYIGGGQRLYLIYLRADLLNYNR